MECILDIKHDFEDQILIGVNKLQGYENSITSSNIVIRRNKTYRFCNNLSASCDINGDLKKHPCPLVTAWAICNVWDASLLVSGGFHPGFATINRHIYSLNATATS